MHSFFSFPRTHKDQDIITDRVKERYAKGPEWEKNEDVRLNPESIAKVRSHNSSLASNLG